MTREELYAIVWDKPMVHVAKRFGISDVGLRKVCVKHNVPTPPLGYWAKLAHGKRVHKPALPAVKDGIGSHVYLTERAVEPVPEAVSAARRAAQEREQTPEQAIVVPQERPDKLHPIAGSVERKLRKAKPDREGYVHCKEAELPEVSISPQSIERAAVLIDTLIKALVAREHGLSDAENRFRLVADGEPFVLRLYETRGKKPHVLTPEDTRRRADYEKMSRQFPSIYPADRRPSTATWDYFPSGRLALEITDPTIYPWNAKNVVCRWYDRSNTKVEGYMTEAIVALATASAAAKHRRAIAEEKERQRREEAERRKREQDRRERVKKRHDFLTRKADENAQFRHLEALWQSLKHKIDMNGAEPIDRIGRVLLATVSEMGSRFDREPLNIEIENLGLFGDDDEV